MNLLPMLLTMMLFGCGSVHGPGPSPTGSAIQCGPDNNYTCAAGLLCYYGEAAGQVFGKCLTPPADKTDDGGVVQPDMGGVQGPAPGCKSGFGYTISPTSAGCPGVIAADPSMSACAPGWSACATNPLSADACKGRKPFLAYQACFIGAVRASDRNNPTDAQSVIGSWSGAEANSFRYIMGCGACIGWAEAATTFGGFTNTVSCDQTADDFQCPKSVPGKDSDFLKVSNKDPNSGVLCCKG